ncbi:unnamed protein product [Chironomus riparius]|uniref:Transposase domain-containing protein n=1 Tax=Chironomus riparius TaxID=315576 RepID=A0A9N9S4E6_9DIPT|nr:unnamed protein product [Chironomus riparius]
MEKRNQHVEVEENSQNISINVQEECNNVLFESSSGNILDVRSDESNSMKCDQNDNIQNNIDNYDMTKYIEQVLCQNTIKFNFKRTGLTNILKDLKTIFPLIKTDYRSIMKTPRTTVLKFIGPGYYVNFNWENQIKLILSECSSLETVKIKLDCFIDGAAFQTDAICKSFWIILGRVLNKIFVIGLYNGRSHPKSFNIFLSDFVSKFKKLSSSKINIGGKEYQIKLGNFLLDTPAKASVKYVKGATGYHSCNECYVRGYRAENRMTFCNLDREKRTDETFRARLDIEHHMGTSILESEFHNLDMVKNFPPDYLHIVLLGGLRKMLNFLFIPPHSHLPLRVSREMTEKLQEIDPFIPSEYHRHMRSISELNLYHGHELRFFLLKIGIVALKNVIPSEFYKNFLFLHVGITILTDKILSKTHHEIAKVILRKFVETAMELYGTIMQTLIVHTISHLSDAVKFQGMPLDEFSTFPFECFLTNVKKLVHSPNKPLQQIHRRIAELLMRNESDEKKNSTLDKFKFVSNRDNTVINVSWDGKKLSTVGVRDRYLILKDGKICEVVKIFKQNDIPVFICNAFIIKGNLYSIPIESSKLHIFVCKNELGMFNFKVEFENILYKMIRIPYDEDYVFIPIKS